MASEGAKRPRRLTDPRLVIRTVLVLVAVAGLALDAYVHFDLAPNYAVNKTSVISQAGMFRIEAVVAILSALALLLRPRRYTAAIAFVIAASALAALLVTRYSDIGAIGPIPSMYEPIWFTEKLVAGYAEGIAAIASAGVFALLMTRTTTSPPPTSTSGAPLPAAGRARG